MKETPILQVNELTKRYGATTALEGVSIAFRRGEVHALVGENGAGKSTLSKIIAGAVQPTEGTLTIKGQTVTGLSPMQAKKLGISMVYQEFNLVPELPVYENLYVKQFVLYNDESVNYYFQESGSGELITTEKKTLSTDKERKFAGKYQKLNTMTDMNSSAERLKAMLEFEEEEQMADQIFKVY